MYTRRLYNIGGERSGVPYIVGTAFLSNLSLFRSVLALEYSHIKRNHSLSNDYQYPTWLKIL